MIAEELLRIYRGRLAERTVADLRIGLGYTAVKLDSGSTGLAATLRYNLPRGCSLLDRAGEFLGDNAVETGELLKRPDPLLSGIGLATINAIANQDVESNTSSPLEALSISDNDRVGMVGNFQPLIDPIKKITDELYVFEREPSAEEEIHPDWATNYLLPKCDVSIISSTTLINGTLEHLLELSRGRTALLGPSTPLSPSLKDRGISYLFGSVVTDPAEVLKIASQGGGTRNFGAGVEKINLKL